MAIVNVDMGFCGNVHSVNVTRNGEGNLDVNIETSCENIRSYNLLLKTLTINDIMGSDSPVFAPERLRLITPGCLVPAAVMTAAWTEIGMIPAEKTKGKTNSVTIL